MSQRGNSEVTDLRPSRRLELMNGSKPCGPSGNARAPSRRRTRGAIRLAPFPSPRPSPLGPLGRGRIGPRAAKDQTRLMVRNGFDCCSLSHRERVRVRGNHRNSDPAYLSTPGTVELRESSGRAGGFSARLLAKNEVTQAVNPPACAAERTGAAGRPAHERTSAIRVYSCPFVVN